jgi:hypothetical protein
MKLFRNKKIDLLIVLGSSVLLGALLSFVSPGDFQSGAWRSTLFILVLAILFYAAYRYLEIPKKTLLITFFAFLVRIGIGIWLTNSIPVIGFDTDVQNAGYIYSDAYERDRASYMVAFPDRWDDFDPSKYQGMDQYGGLTAISAGIYRFFSSDKQRPLLIVFLSAFFMSLGILFLWSALKSRWTERIAFFACIVMAVYPEGIILGSSQMREPLLIGLAAITFWMTIVFSLGCRRYLLFASFIVISLLTCWISLPGGLVILMVEVGYLFVKVINDRHHARRKKILVIAFVGFLLISAIAGWIWLKDTLYYDSFVTESESGLIAYILDIVGEGLRFPFVLFYGLIQPVLPAALVYQTLPVWKGIAIFRAGGWYLAIPFLIYSIFAVYRSSKREKSWGLFWLVAVLVVWIFVSSARAGGDLWDNPRYRAIFLPWLALIAGWVWDKITRGKAPWFWRIVLIEAVFVVLFTNWYITRKIGAGVHIPIQYLIILFVLFMISVIVVGIVLDRKGAKKKIDPTN